MLWELSELLICFPSVLELIPVAYILRSFLMKFEKLSCGTLDCSKFHEFYVSMIFKYKILFFNNMIIWNNFIFGKKATHFNKYSIVTDRDMTFNL